MQNFRPKLSRDIQRYRFLLHNISNPVLIALLEEMIAETGAQLATLDDQWRFGDWGLDPTSKSATMPTGKQVRLTRGEFDLLFAFLTHANQILTREDLMQMVQSRVVAPRERTTDVLVNRLRRKLEADPRHPKHIKTVRSEGYVFCPRTNV